MDGILISTIRFYFIYRLTSRLIAIRNKVLTQRMQLSMQLIVCKYNNCTSLFFLHNYYHHHDLINDARFIISSIRIFIFNRIQIYDKYTTDDKYTTHKFRYTDSFFSFLQSLIVNISRNDQCINRLILVCRRLTHRN